MFKTDLLRLNHKREGLNPALRPYVAAGGKWGDVISHPLIHEMYYPQQNAVINERYRQKKDALDKALAEKKWKTVMWIHERPYRINALLEYQHIMTHREYWECVAEVWPDSENIWQFYDDWRTLWENPRPDKRYAMTIVERRKLALMPDVITVYRGIHGKGISKARNRRGLSWTTDKAKAEWFATRWKAAEPNTRLLTGRVNKCDVHAYFDKRNEHEIISSLVKI